MGRRVVGVLKKISNYVLISFAWYVLFLFSVIKHSEPLFFFDLEKDL